MAFDVNTITVQGTIAVASATVGNKFVIDGCDATTDVLTQAQAAQIAVRPGNPGSTTTEISLAGSTDNHVFAYAEFLQGESTGGDFNTFYLYGHLQDMPDTVVVIAVASASATTHIPETGDVTNRTEIQFDLTFTPNADVVKVADTSMYCTRGEFLILKDRVVTTHKEGEPTTGESQTIYGNKTFNGYTTVWALEPQVPNISNIGDENKKFDCGYFRNVFSYQVVLGYTNQSANNSVFSTTNQDELEVICKGPSVTVATTTDDLSTYPLSYIKLERDSNGASFDILAQDSSTETDGKVRVHSVNSTANLKKLKMEMIKGTYESQLILSVGTHSNNTDACGFSIGIKNGSKQAYVFAQEYNSNYAIYLDAPSIFLFGDLIPSSANTYSLGNSTDGFADVYANNLHGVIPLPAKDSDSNVINVPIGGIVLAYHESHQVEQYARPGHFFTIIDPAQAYWYTALSDGSGTFSQGTPLGPGSYRYLSDMALTSIGLGGVALLIRVA